MPLTRSAQAASELAHGPSVRSHIVSMQRFGGRVEFERFGWPETPGT